MRLTTLLILIGCCSVSTTFADDASRHAAALRLLEASKAAEMIDTVYETMEPQFAAMAEQMGIDESRRPIFERHMARTIAVLREELNWERMEPLMAKAYAEVYTEDELLQLADFYQSPLGQKFIEKMPEMVNLMMATTQDMMTGFYARIDELRYELERDIAMSDAMGSGSDSDTTD